jgi:chorismate mutase/GNAT superfamily N-acetyltransferase
VTAPEVDLVLRAGRREDAAAVAALFLTSRSSAGTAMPAPVHDQAATERWLTGRLEAHHRGGPVEVWVAEAGPEPAPPVGFLLLEADWLHSLYVHPDHARRGVGSALLDLAKSLRPQGFSLWVFASNAPARRFYLRHGLWELEHTDGSGNEERAPDVRMVWLGKYPVTFLRGEIDEVDTELARVLARRAAITAAIQAHKEVPGEAGRDRRREAQIAERMAGLAPALGRERLATIMDAVITESLAAARQPERRPME